MRARKVDTYYASTITEYVNNDPVTVNLLTKLFHNATLDSSKTEIIYDEDHPDRDIYGLPLFQNIWLPLRKVKKVGNDYVLDENSTYYNVGILPDEIADIYWAHYSGTYLIGKQENIAQDLTILIKKVKAVFKENLGKYLKLIELQGLEWNPLWNVDGTEIKQLLENNGTTDVEGGSMQSNIGVQYDNSKRIHKTSPYDSATMKTDEEETNDGNGSDVPTGIQRVEYLNNSFEVTSQTIGPTTHISHADNYSNGRKDSTKYIHNNAKNLVNGSETDYAVKASDTAFGDALTGGDKMHVEKIIRRGNIGVTKTTELIEDARKALSYIILDEFFKDINKVILVGLYGRPVSKSWYPYSEDIFNLGHPDTGRTSSVYNTGLNMIQSIELDQFGHVVGLTTGDGITRMSTPMSQEEYDDTDPKDLPLYYIYDDE